MRIWKQYRSVIGYAVDKATKNNDHLSIGLWFKSQSKAYRNKLGIYSLFVSVAGLVIYYLLDNEKSYWRILLLAMELVFVVEYLKAFDLCNKTCNDLLGHDLIKISPDSFNQEGFPYLLKQHKSGFINKELFNSAMNLTIGGYSSIAKFGLVFELYIMFHLYTI
jgi:uncharacterized protein YjeT (DUF2065 family)